MNKMCFRLCLNDVFLQPESENSDGLYHIFVYLETAGWLTGFLIFHGNVWCWGDCTVRVLWGGKKIYIKVFFPIAILYFMKWLWGETWQLKKGFWFPSPQYSKSWPLSPLVNLLISAFQLSLLFSLGPSVTFQNWPSGLGLAAVYVLNEQG